MRKTLDSSSENIPQLIASVKSIDAIMDHSSDEISVGIKCEADALSFV